MAFDAAAWAALALALSVLGGVLSYAAWRRRGAAAGLRVLAWALVPAALWATGTLKLAGRIVDAVTSWAVHLVFSPLVWLGIVLGGLAVVLFGVSGAMKARGLGVRTRPGRPAGTGETKQLPRTKARRGTPADGLEGMDDIEAILRKHGIS